MKLTTHRRITVVLTKPQYEQVVLRAEEAQSSLATIIRQVIAKGLGG